MDSKLCSIKLSQDKTAFVDPEDYTRISEMKWHASCCLARGLFYAAHEKRVADGLVKRRSYKTILMHRLLVDATPMDRVIHLDGDTLNNQKANLLKIAKKAKVAT